MEKRILILLLVALATLATGCCGSEATPLPTATPAPPTLEPVEPTNTPGLPPRSPLSPDSPLSPVATPAPDARTGRIVMILPHEAFRDEEYIEPRAEFEARGYEVTVASSSLETATGMLGAEVQPDIPLGDVVVSEYDAVVFVGGGGAQEYWDDPEAHRIAREAVTQEKVLAAICIAPVTLARAGVLEGKEVTVFESGIAEVEAGGATYFQGSVVIDGLIITANGPAASAPFGEAIVDALAQPR